MAHRRWYFVGLVSLFALAAAACGPNGGSDSGPECRSDDQCAEGEVCRASACRTSCSTDSDCSGADGDTCQFGGLCLTSCESDGDCGGDEVCHTSSGTCWPQGATPSNCESDTDCQGTQYCASGICLASSCASDSECGGQNICAQGSCRSGCRPAGEGPDRTECPEGEVCNSSNLCEPEGCRPGDCDEFLQCDTDMDPPQCQYTGNCDSDSICGAYKDQIDSDIPHICDEDGNCVEKPPCEADEDCASNEICEEDPDGRNTCRPGCRCTSEDECDRFCIDGVCDQETNECTSGCQTDEQCRNQDEGFYCIDNQCKSRCGAAGGEDESESCTPMGNRVVCSCPTNDGGRAVCRGDGDGHRICQPCTNDNQCPPTKFCDFNLGLTEEQQQDGALGLCTKRPPACPTDGFNDNHAETSAYAIENLPFEKTPNFCNNPASNDAYNNNGGEWFSFTGQGGKVVDIQVDYSDNREAGNLDVALISGSGEEIVASARPPDRESVPVDDRGTNGAEAGGFERIVYGVQATQEFKIHVRGTITEENIPYDISVDVRDPRPCDESNDDQFEDNDSVQSPASLDEGAMYDDLTVCGDDEDFYTLDAEANQNVQITMNARNALGNLDLYLYDSDQQIVARSVGENDKEEIVYATQEAQELVVEVRVAQGFGQVDYGLSWSQSPNRCADRFEPNDACPSGAAELTRDPSKLVEESGLTVCTDKDFYKIDLVSQDQVQIEASYNEMQANGTLQLTLFGPNDCQTLVQSANEVEDGDRQILTIDHEVQQGGTFYVLAERFQGVGNIPYDLTVDVTSGPQCVDDREDRGGRTNDTRSEATQLDADEIKSGGPDAALVGQKICDRNVDWYCTTLEDSETIEWDVVHSADDGNLDASIYSGPQSSVVETASTSDDDETLSHTNSSGSSGEYCIKVEGASPVRNDYWLLSYIDGQGPSSPQCPDHYEENDVCTQPDTTTNDCTAAQLDEGKTDTLLVCGDPDDPDWYQTCVQPGETLTVNASSAQTSGSMNLQLYDPEGVQSDQDIDSAFGPGTPPLSVSSYSTKEQCYYYNVSVPQSLASKSYSLDVVRDGPTPCDDDSFEPNDDASDAPVLETPGLNAGLRKCESDVDWYEVDLTQGRKYEFFVNHAVDDGDIDVELFEGTGSGSAGSSVKAATSQTDDESLVVEPGPGSDEHDGGTHYLKVTSKDKARLSYDLLLYEDLDENGSIEPEEGEGPQDRECPDQFEQNDQSSTAAGIDVSSYTGLTMCAEEFQSDKDFYEIYVPSGATLTVDLGFNHANGNIDMNLYRGDPSNSSPVASGTSTTSNESVSATNSQDGATYTVEVLGVDGPFRNTYSMSVGMTYPGTCTEDRYSGNRDASTAATSGFLGVDSDGSNSLKLCEASDTRTTEDWYQFTPSQDTTLTAQIDYRKTLGEIELHLRDSAMSSGDPAVAEASSSMNGSVKTLDGVSVDGGKTYYLRVFAANNSVIRNAYDMWVGLESGPSPSEPLCPDPYERNDEGEGDVAEPIDVFTQSTFAGQYAGSVACGSEQDWYKVDLDSGTTYHLDAFFDHGSDTDLDLEVRDGPVSDSNASAIDDTDSNTIEFGNDTTDDDEQETFQPGSSGTYYVGVENKGSGETLYPFQIVPESQYSESGSGDPCPEDEYEDNNGAGSAKPLPSDLPVREALGACDSEDWFQWRPEKSQQATVTAFMDNDFIHLGLEVNRVTLDSDGNVQDVTQVGSDLGRAGKSDNRARVSFSADETGSNGSPYYEIAVSRAVPENKQKEQNGPYFLTIENK